MIRSVRQSLFAALAVALALALLPAFAGVGQAAPASQGQARIAVAIFPDLVGDGAGDADCPGCDGDYTSEDTAANASEPLPALEIVLRDAEGMEIDRNTTSGLANGRQVTFFSVEAAGDYDVEVTGLPEAWQVCPDGTLTVDLTADDFDEITGFASVDVFVWLDCDAPTVEAAAEGAAAEGEKAAEGATAGAEVATAEQPAGEEEATVPVESAAAITATVAITPTEPSLTVPTDVPPATVSTVPAPMPTEGATVPSEEVAVGAIRGVVYEDANENGKLDPGEYGIPGAMLRAVGLGGTLNATTAGAGTYAFADLGTGSYDVYLDVPPGAETTTPDRYVGVAVDGGVVMGMDFGLKLATGTVAPTPIPPAESPALPSTGVQLQPRGRSLIALALAAGVLGALGLALETRLGRRSLTTGKEGEDE